MFVCSKNVFCCRINEMSSVVATPKCKKRKIAETSNVITETLPTVEGEQVSGSAELLTKPFVCATHIFFLINECLFQVEIEVIGEGSIEVEESGVEEVVDAAKNSQAESDDSALALLADITSKYQQEEPVLHVIKKGDIEEVWT